MTPKQRVEAALTGQNPDWVPFTVFEALLPTGEVERRLRNDGLCIVRPMSVVTSEYEEVTIERTTFTGQDGVERVRTAVCTPVGELTAIDRHAVSSSWHEKRFFTSQKDYEPLYYMIQDRRYRPNYGDFAKVAARLGHDAAMRTRIGYEPLQDIIITLMCLEEFAVQWADNRDRVLKLHELLVEDRRKVYPIVADSPAWTANYGGNVVAEVVGLERFEKMIVPQYEEAAEVLHAKGKLIGVHFDANTKLLAPAIARTHLDYIEAFTPYPDTDMSVADAREAWPDKALWINYPSSVHLQSITDIEDMMRKILKEAAPGERFLIGITEDVPEDRWAGNYEAILRVCRQEGRLPIRG